MKRVEVYKRTTDDWYPAFTSSEGDLVEVSFLQLREDGWRVCVWGNDDAGMEKDFPHDQENSAFCCFLEVIGMDDVTVDSLVKLGFVSA